MSFSNPPTRPNAAYVAAWSWPRLDSAGHNALVERHGRDDRQRAVNQSHAAARSRCGWCRSSRT